MEPFDGVVEPKLLRTPASGDLLPARFAPVLAKWAAPRAKLRGYELRLAIDLSLDDDACMGFVLEFMAQGARIEASARGAGAPLLVWALHELARMTKSTFVRDVRDVHDAHHVHDAYIPERDAALAYLRDYEADVAKTRREGLDRDGDLFVAWLAREGLILLAGDAKTDFSELPLEDAAATYELLVDAENVDDIFVSERELARLLGRFRAR